MALTIVHPETRAVLPPGETGEILVAGYVTPGYYRDPEHNARAFDAEGYFLTGDLGMLDAEGRLHFRGRLKDLIKSGGINISPLEVEAYLMTYPKVQYAAVVGLPDTTKGEVPVVAVQLREGETATAEEIRGFCRDHIASYKIPQCGAGVTRFMPGDRVMAILPYGGLAEQALAAEDDTFAIPDGMRFEEAGAFPIAYCSSHVALRWQGRLAAGETLLVLGAAGGVGLTAVEIGKVMGARVIAGASTAEKLAVAQEHGADDLINYTTEPLTERVMSLTHGAGVDVCFDQVGGDLFDAALSALGWGGRILLVGFVGGGSVPPRCG